MPLVSVYRDTATTLSVPAVLHWNLGHHSALVEQSGDLFRIVDPALGGSRWISRLTLLSEMSGYALLPDEATDGWRPVPDAEAAR